MTCIGCDAEISVARSYFRFTGLLTFGILFVVGLITYSINAIGRWILYLFLLGVPLRFLLFSLVPPWYEKGYTRPKITFGLIWILFAVFMTLYYLVIGGVALDLGGANEMHEHLGSLSFPLSLFHKNFQITSQTLPLDLIGITFGNALFYSALMTSCFFFVRTVFRRSRVTQMDLSGRSVQDDDD